MAPNSAETRKELIEIQLSGGKGEDALATARSYAGKNPGSAADILLAETLTRLKRTNEAEDLLEKSFDRKPDAHESVRFGQIAASSGDAKKARPVLAKWLAKDPDNFAVRSEYAASLMAVGDFADARKEYETLLKNHPYDPNHIEQCRLSTPER